MLFNHAYCTVPSCAPSRSAVLTGQYAHRLEQGGNLYGWLPAKFPIYTEILEEKDYFIGATCKLWSPGDNSMSGRRKNPCEGRKGQAVFKFWRKDKDGNRANDGMAAVDYSENFKWFVQQRNGRPFCFWYGSGEPHRGYKKGIGLTAGKKIEDVKVPPFLPDTPEIRKDILDYYYEVEHFDRELGKMLDYLEEIGELDNTLIVVTSDNGMPFPRAKCNLYDSGTRMPMAVRWGKNIKPGSVCDDFVNLIDLAPTFLEAAGMKPIPEMTGRSIVSLLKGMKPKQSERGVVFTERERHTPCRGKDGKLSYPCRMIRTHDYLYIWNIRPNLWPAGDPPYFQDVDGSPSKNEILGKRDEKEIAPFFKLAFAKRPEEELFDLKKDPWQVNNVADQKKYAEIKKKMRARLEKWMKDTDDPRAKGETDQWDEYPFTGGNKWKEKGKFEYLKEHKDESPYYEKMYQAELRKQKSKELKTGKTGKLQKGPFVSKWNIIGPFDLGGNIKEFNQFLPAEKINFKAKYRGKGNKEVSWQVAEAGYNGIVNLARIFDFEEKALACAVCYVYSPKKSKHTICLGSDDGVIMKLNKKEVWNNPAIRPVKPDEDLFQATFNKGWNEVLLKISQGGGGWAFAFRIIDDSKSIKVSLRPEK